MKGLKFVDTAIIKARAFASTIHNSQPIFEELEKIFIIKNKPFLYLILMFQLDGTVHF